MTEQTGWQPIPISPELRWWLSQFRQRPTAPRYPKKDDPDE